MTNLGLPDPVHGAGLMLRAFADPDATTGFMPEHWQAPD